MIWKDLKDLTFPSAVELNLLAKRLIKKKTNSKQYYEPT